MNYLLHETIVTLREKDCILRPKTITRLKYRLMASAAIIAKVTRKKYWRTAPENAQKPFVFLLCRATMNER